MEVQLVTEAGPRGGIKLAQHVIGMFDSGVGGLTVMKEIVTQLPDVQIIYFGDTARVPYGNRSREELIHFGEEIISFLIEQGAEAIVVACNTSSANAVPVLREQFNLPLIGTIEPGAKAAIQATATGNIGLIATEATVRSKAYSSAVRRILSKRRGGHAIELVKAQACPLFVPLVEAGLSHSPEARGIARTYLAPIQEAQVDALILGCTHYPFLAPVIQEILGEEIILVDPAQAMTEELKEVLKQLEYNRESGQETHKAPGHHRFFVSGDPVLFERVGNTLLPDQIHDVNQVNWNR
ncbi:glutamate racemase [Desulfitobacterium sp. LBE]|uniref:Glutamate racemase n=4 Tax=root TaxID=1 RepID=A0A098B3C8_DESHA|nr:MULTISPECIES: glutamate racemase [Desulfitobacterium]ACL22409.1 glutamate racemase [Desulfitobacterium hafniense DCB-2]EHL04164.1 glutamate racemase [Desulfitobacterium hafniense DP7]MEA5023956.1 glutamate racemase [Desulfitobacterium hafniense]TWH59807.1 glutamate racemase [Desulfitobacterium sp. LBE]CDX03373.1 Glutamate racemase [Desulfitobacterium hafniense]